MPTLTYTVTLDASVARALSNVASAHRTDIPGLLAAAARHVARTQGGLRVPVYRLRPPDIPIPGDSDDEADAVPAPRPRNVAAPGAAWSRPNAVGRRKGERFAPAVRSAQVEVVRMYVEDLCPMRTIGERFGFSPTTVRALLVDAQVEIRPKGWIIRSNPPAAPVLEGAS